MRDQRRLAFGSVAELYDRRRPAYPAELVDAVIAYAGIATSGAALEVGVGTGKATVQFAQRGIPVHGLEPSLDMAAVARRSCAGFEMVEIEEIDFEHFDGADGHFQLVFSAQAWHWVSPDVRAPKARAALKPGGALALFWNSPAWGESPHRQALLEAYEKVGADWDTVGGHGPMYPSAREPFPARGDEEIELRDSPTFGEPERHLYRWSRTYNTTEYVELLGTHSDHILLAERERESLLNAVTAAVDGLGGEVEVAWVTALTLARAV